MLSSQTCTVYSYISDTSTAGKGLEFRLHMHRMSLSLITAVLFICGTAALKGDPHVEVKVESSGRQREACDSAAAKPVAKPLPRHDNHRPVRPSKQYRK